MCQLHFCRAILLPSCSVRVSVCLSVRVSRSCILSKRINIFSKFFHRQTAITFQFFFLYDTYSDWNPQRGLGMQVGYAKILNFWLITGELKSTISTVDRRVVYSTCMLGRPFNAAFHYSSKLQTWLQTWLSTCVSVSRARRKQVESMSKACRKHVANPHELIENLAANLVESQVCSQVCSWLNNGMWPLPRRPPRTSKWVLFITSSTDDYAEDNRM